MRQINIDKFKKIESRLYSRTLLRLLNITTHGHNAKALIIKNPPTASSITCEDILAKPFIKYEPFNTAQPNNTVHINPEINICTTCFDIDIPLTAY